MKDDLRRYLREIRKYPTLSPGEELRLVRRVREGDMRALDALVRCNLRLIPPILAEYEEERRARGLELADLINEANLGLIRAAHKIDDIVGASFAARADPWIREAIRNALAEAE